MSIKKPLKTFQQDEEGYPMLPEPQRVEMKLPEQKEFIRSYITHTYSKNSVWNLYHVLTFDMQGLLPKILKGLFLGRI
jgi:hypothetical protein